MNRGFSMAPYGLFPPSPWLPLPGGKMSIDFENAALRHCNDAERLYQLKERPNADHLFGLAAECALKYFLMKENLLVLDAKGKPCPTNTNKKSSLYMVHINGLWKEFSGSLCQRNANFYISLIDDSANPFNDWDINHRYWNGNAIPLQNIDKHRLSAQRLIAGIEKLKLDGILP